jgi:hypothetical protein
VRCIRRPRHRGRRRRAPDLLARDRGGQASMLWIVARSTIFAYLPPTCAIGGTSSRVGSHFVRRLSRGGGARYLSPGALPASGVIPASTRCESSSWGCWRPSSPSCRTYLYRFEAPRSSVLTGGAACSRSPIAGVRPTLADALRPGARSDCAVDLRRRGGGSWPSPRSR